MSSWNSCFKVFLIISGWSDFSFLFTFFLFLCILVIYTCILYIIKIFDFLKFSDKILIFESFFWDMESINGHSGPHLLASKPFIRALPLRRCTWTHDLLDQWICSQQSSLILLTPATSIRTCLPSLSEGCERRANNYSTASLSPYASAPK